MLALESCRKRVENLKAESAWKMIGFSFRSHFRFVMHNVVLKFGSSRATEGHIQLIFGPMFSGKTTEMLRRINRYRLANRVCRVVKYRRDTRYDDDKVATHDLQLHDAVSAVKISEVWNDLLSAQVIGIDEGQFFEDVVDCAENLANLGKIVIVAALDGDFNRKRFKNNIIDLCPLSENITKLTAVCTKCGEDAAFTFRLTSDLSQEVIGGKEMYTALCRSCYLDASKFSLNVQKQRSPLKGGNCDRKRIQLDGDDIEAAKKLRGKDDSIINTAVRA